MVSYLVAILATISFLLPLSSAPCFANTEISPQEPELTTLELPEALADDDSFDSLPFEQLRQALREEVERDPNRNTNYHSQRKYNLLIR